MSKLSKTNPQHSTPSGRAAKKSNAEWCEYLDLTTFKMAPANHQSKLRIFMELYTWANENDRAYSIKQFFTMKKMDPFCVYNWLEEDEQYKTIYKATISALAARREMKGLERELDAGLVRLSMPMYCDEWKKLEEWRAKLGEKAAEAGTKIVVIEKFSRDKTITESE